MSTLHIPVTPQQLARRHPSAQPERVQPTRGPDGKALRPRVARGRRYEPNPRPTLADPGQIGLLEPIDPRDPNHTPRFREVQPAAPVSAGELRKRRASARHALREPLLVPVDLTLEAWAGTPITGDDGTPHLARASFWPSASADHLPPLDQDTTDLIAGIIRAAPRPIRKLITWWYIGELPVVDIADVLEIREREVYEQRICALWYMRGRLEGSGIHFTH